MKNACGWVMVALLSSSCASPLPYLRGQTPSPAVDGLPGPLLADESGRGYCARLGSVADTNAQKSFVGGVALTIAAAIAVVVGGFWGPDIDPAAGPFARNRNALVIASGGILGIPAGLLLSHSSVSSAASAKSISAMALLNEEAAMTECLVARQAILDGRAALARTAKTELERQVDIVKTLGDEQDRLVKEKAAEPDNTKKATIQSRIDDVAKARSEVIQKLAAP